MLVESVFLTHVESDHWAFVLSESPKNSIKIARKNRSVFNLCLYFYEAQSYQLREDKRNNL